MPSVYEVVGSHDYSDDESLVAEPGFAKSGKAGLVWRWVMLACSAYCHSMLIMAPKASTIAAGKHVTMTMCCNAGRTTSSHVALAPLMPQQQMRTLWHLLQLR